MTAGAYPTSADLSPWRCDCLSPHHRPACLLVALVVLILPRRAAAVAHIAGDGDGARLAVFLALAALQRPGALRQLRSMPWQGSHSAVVLSSFCRARSLVMGCQPSWAGVGGFVCCGAATVRHLRVQRHSLVAESHGKLASSA